jgi:lantibiotic modifying enzyme
LYSGTSGVALFLAELHAAAEDPVARRTALGAIRQVLWSVGAQLPPNRLGLYTGRGGIAYAAARVGTVLGEEELLERAAEVLQGSARDNQDEHGFDLLSGSAGAIATLLALRDVLEDASLLVMAMRLGDELLQTADRSEAGYSWRSTAFPNHRHLTGFSHGAAGVGYALLELFHATGDAKYRRGAEHAFQYERYWFDAEAGNWPDFRGERAQGKRCKRPMAFATSWCHGAPGIALSRLRAYEILKDPTCQAEAMTALQTTRQTVETVLHSGMGNYSLCHGLAGNAELLLQGYQVLGQEWADGYALAHEVANIGIETYAARGLSWPCGTGGGETPGLLLGLAGIGHFYLRLHDPTTPSILMVQREHWTSGRYS